MALETKKSRVHTLLGIVFTALGLTLALHSPIPSEQKVIERGIASQPFPRHQALRSEDDILDQYKDYLAFVVSVARTSHASDAKQLQDQFSKLEKEHPAGAARFLKTLRQELDHKVALLRIAPGRVSSSHPKLQPWVGKFLPLWLRSIDEARFRAYTDKLIASRPRQAKEDTE